MSRRLIDMSSAARDALCNAPVIDPPEDRPFFEPALAPMVETELRSFGMIDRQGCLTWEGMRYRWPGAGRVVIQKDVQS